MVEARASRLAQGWRSAKRIERRVGLPLIDQMASTLSNFLLTIIAARSLSPINFGAFSIAYTVYVLSVNCGRSTIGHVVLSSARDEDEQQHGPSDTPQVTGASFGIGLLVALVLIVVGLAIHGPVGLSLVVLGVAMPILLGQDATRYCFIAAGHAGWALISDSIWLIFMLPILILGRHHGHWSAAWLLGYWAIGALVAGIYSCVQGRLLPSPLRAWTWIGRRLKLLIPYFGEYASVSAGYQIAMLAATPIVGLLGVGGLRAANVFFGPVTIFGPSLYIVLIPAGNRRKDDAKKLARLVIRGSSGLIAIVIVWTLIGLALPSGIGVDILGKTWYSARPLLLPTGLGLAMAIGIVGPLSGLRSLRAARHSLRARMWSLPLMLGFSLSFAVAWGVKGFAVGSALESAVTFAMVIAGFRRANATSGPARERLYEYRKARHAAQRRSMRATANTDAVPSRGKAI